jgi:hypothetical protein
VLPIAFRHGHALELHRMRGLCGLTLRERAAPGGAVATQYGGGELVERRAADGVRVVRLKDGDAVVGVASAPMEEIDGDAADGAEAEPAPAPEA